MSEKYIDLYDLVDFKKLIDYVGDICYDVYDIADYLGDPEDFGGMEVWKQGDGIREHISEISYCINQLLYDLEYMKTQKEWEENAVKFLASTHQHGFVYTQKYKIPANLYYLNKFFENWPEGFRPKRK